MSARESENKTVSHPLNKTDGISNTHTALSFTLWISRMSLEEQKESASPYDRLLDQGHRSVWQWMISNQKSSNAPLRLSATDLFPQRHWSLALDSKSFLCFQKQLEVFLILIRKKVSWCFYFVFRECKKKNLSSTDEYEISWVYFRVHYGLITLYHVYKGGIHDSLVTKKSTSHKEKTPRGKRTIIQWNSNL